MDRLSYPSQPDAAPADAPEYTLRVTGAVRLALVINLGSFVVDADADTFRHLRDNDMRLQWQGNRTNNLGVLLAGVVLFMAVSSFLADTFNVLDRLNEQDGWTLLSWIITVFLGILFMLLAVRRLRDRAARKQHPKARHALQRLHNR